MHLSTVDQVSILGSAQLSVSSYLGRLANGGFPLTFLALDPGLTTGFAEFQAGVPIRCGQANTPNVDLMCEFLACFPMSTPRYVVENYIIYKDKARDHINSEVTTIRLIGCIETIAHQRKPDVARVYFQTAAQAKGYVTDARLKSLGLYQIGLKHANDAMRHGLYFVTFGPTAHPIAKQTTHNPTTMRKRNEAAVRA